MPFADKVVHVTMSGNMLGGGEIWQTGFYVGKAQGAPDAITQPWLDGVRDAWVTFFRIAGIAHQSYTFTEAKAALLGTDGKYTGGPALTSHPATAIIGNYQGQMMPPQIALVATLIAGSGKGLAGKGRMYLPGVSSGIDSNGRLADSFTQQVATNLATFFNTINALPGKPGVAINASKGTKKLEFTFQRNVPINGIRVGNVYDTQRRRRNGLTEVYKNAVVADA